MYRWCSPSTHPTRVTAIERPHHARCHPPSALVAPAWHQVFDSPMRHKVEMAPKRCANEVQSTMTTRTVMNSRQRFHLMFTTIALDTRGGTDRGEQQLLAAGIHFNRRACSIYAGERQGTYPTEAHNWGARGRQRPSPVLSVRADIHVY